MVSGFDLAAQLYDSSFTHSPVGQLQRGLVYRVLKRYLGSGKPLNILEINCGTGEDAQFMVQRGHQVLATDLSEKMLEQARSKTGHNPNLNFQKLDITKLSENFSGRRFDMLFSNFGGLNCLSPVELESFMEAAYQKLNPTGLLIMVVMPKKCLWDRFYHFLKGQRKKVFRRSSPGPLQIEVGGKEVPTWYYDPRELIAITNSKFKKLILRPIGFTVPPSYLNAFFRDKRKLLNFLAWIDGRLFFSPRLAAYSDHFILVLQRK